MTLQEIIDSSDNIVFFGGAGVSTESGICLLYTSDAADDLIGVDLGGRRIIKKKIFSSRRRHTRCLRVSWARRCV